ncbi:phage tail length tape measure family protein [Rhizobium sp.]|uniref:phage tail length tape measure family protein n=1 Tax=Rhizobium sp. TaxID=391 RepID=UPI0028A03D91
MAVDNSDDLIISISTDQATLRRSIKRIEQDLGTLAGSVKRQFDNVGKTVDSSLTTSLQNRINAMTGVGAQAAKEWTGALADQGKELERLRARYSPLFNTINNYKAAVADIRRAHALGAISANEMAAAMSKERQAALASIAAIKGRNAALVDTPSQRAMGGGGTGYTSNIAAQFQDIGVTAAMGMSPMMIALQQGTQLSAVLNQMGNGRQVITGLGAAFASIVSPVSLVTIGLVAGSAALLQYGASWFSGGGDKISAELEKQHEVLSRVVAKWGDAVPNLKAYADELERVKTINDAISAGDTVAKAQFTEAQAALRGVADEFERALLVLNANPNNVGVAGDLASSYQNLVKQLAEGKATSSDLAAAQDALTAAVSSGLPEVKQLELVWANVANQIRGAIEAMVGARAEAGRVSAATNAALNDPRTWRGAGNIGSGDGPIQGSSDPNLPMDGPTPTRRPLRELEALPTDKKQETAAQRAANAYRDLKKSADDRIAQMQMETALLGKFGVEADAARFALDLLQQAEDKGRSLNDKQRKELEQKVELYRQYSEQLAKAKLAQDLLEQRRYNSMSAADQQVYTTLKQYGLSTDLNSKEAGQIRQSLRDEKIASAADTFIDDFTGALLSGGDDIGKRLGQTILNSLLDSAQDQVSSILKQLFRAAFSPSSGAPSMGGGGSPAVAGVGGAVDLAGGLLGKSETANRGQINSFLKAGGVDLDAAQQAWCAGFVNSSLAQIGVKGSGSNVANSFQNWGSAIDPSKVLRGDVLLQDRGLGAGATGGHVGFATGASRMTDGQLQLQMLSGNSGNAVSTTWVNAAEVQAKRATEAANALGSVADSSKVATQGLGQLGQLSTSFFPSAPSAPSGGGFGGLFSGLFGGGLSAAQIAKYTPMVGLFSNGGDVSGPGSGTSDSIPAMLSDGEFVVNAAATRKHRALLRAINGGRVGHFAAGGLVGGGIAAPVAPSLRSGRSAANNGAPGVMVIHLDGANGDEHVMALAKQAVTDGLGQYNKNQERGGFGTVQGQFTKRKG